MDIQLDFKCASADKVKISLSVVVDNSSTRMWLMVLWWWYSGPYQVSEVGTVTGIPMTLTSYYLFS